MIVEANVRTAIMRLILRILFSLRIRFQKRREKFPKYSSTNMLHHVYKVEERKKYKDRKSNFPESLISQQNLVFDILREVYFSNKPKLLQKHRVWIYNM